MTRRLSLSIVRRGRVVDITREAAAAMGQHVYTLASDEYAPTIRVGGAGMDMHFHTVYSLARSIRPNGHACTGEDRGPRRCPSNDHSNDYGTLSREYDAAHADERANLGPHDGQHGATAAYVSARQDWIAEQRTYDRKRQHRDAGYSLNYRTV